MAKVTVKFNSVWRLYLGIAGDTLESDNIDDALAQLEQKYGTIFTEKWQQLGFKMDGGMLKYSYSALNRKDVKRLQDRSLKDGDVIDMFLAVPGG